MLKLQEHLANIGCPIFEQQLDLIVRITDTEIPVKGFLKDYIHYSSDAVYDETLKRILLLICSQNRDVDAKVFEIVIDCFPTGFDVVSKSKREFMSTAIDNGSIKIVQFLLDRFCIQRADIDTEMLWESYWQGGYTEMFELLTELFEIERPQVLIGCCEIPYYYSRAEPLDDYHAMVYDMWINYLTRSDEQLPDSMLISPMTKSASFGAV